jgi:histidinol phosphatase-like PHP family hydrolase
VTLEALTDSGTVVRVKANTALRVKRSSELEEALKKLGCRVSIETAMNGNGSRV